MLIPWIVTFVSHSFWNDVDCYCGLFPPVDKFAGVVGAVAGFAAGSVPGAVAGYVGGVNAADGVTSGRCTADDRRLR